MAETITLPLADLLIDEENPRISEPNAGQNRALQLLAEYLGPKLATLAADIVAHGIDPADLPIVMPKAGHYGRYTVLEGNRRLAALRILENPDSVSDAVGNGALKRLRSLSKSYQTNPVEAMPCVVVRDRETAKHWIELRHTGENGGAGRVPWGSDEAGRFRTRGVPELHLQAMDFLQRRGDLTAEQRRQIPASSFKRLIETPEVRARLGLTAHKGTNLLDTCRLEGHHPVADHSGRLWSLWDIMRLFKQTSAAIHLCEIVETREHCQRIIFLEGSAGTVYPTDSWGHVKLMIDELHTIATEAGFSAAKSCISMTKSNWMRTGTPPVVSALDADLRQIYDMVMNDMSKCRFLQVPSHLIGAVDNPAWMGLDVAKSFRSALPDLKEAGNCLAADCNTAAVFHLMRAVEWALRAFGAHLGFRQLRVVKKSGKRKLVPISHLEWEKILDQLQIKVDAKIERMRPGKRKQDAQQFYYPALQDIRGIRDAWRNHVMHSRRIFSALDAGAIKDHVERLMVLLATRVTEA